MIAPTESIVRDTVERTTADLRAEVADPQASLAATLLSIEGFLTQAANQEQELDRVITAAAEGAAALLQAERLEIAQQLTALGEELADDAHESDGAILRLVLDARATAYFAAAEIVRTRGNVRMP